MLKLCSYCKLQHTVFDAPTFSHLKRSENVFLLKLEPFYRIELVM